MFETIGNIILGAFDFGRDSAKKAKEKTESYLSERQLKAQQAQEARREAQLKRMEVSEALKSETPDERYNRKYRAFMARQAGPIKENEGYQPPKQPESFKITARQPVNVHSHADLAKIQNQVHRIHCEGCGSSYNKFGTLDLQCKVCGSSELRAERIR